jgi:hypothetical protein
MPETNHCRREGGQKGPIHEIVSLRYSPDAITLVAAKTLEAVAMGKAAGVGACALSKAAYWRSVRCKGMFIFLWF